MSNEFLPDFVIIPYQIMADKEIFGLDIKVYGIIYWYEHLKDGKCFASNEEIARVAGSTANTVSQSLSKLQSRGHIQCVYSDKSKKERLQIRCSYSYRGLSPQLQGVVATATGGVVATATQISNTREVIVESNSYKGTNQRLDNPTPVKDYFLLYRQLYKHRIGIALTVTNWGKAYALLKRLRNSFTHEQTKALIFTHFEWRGLNGDDNFQLTKLVNAGFPLEWLVNSAPQYATYLQKEVAEAWADEALLETIVDKWARQLSDTNNP